MPARASGRCSGSTYPRGWPHSPWRAGRGLPGRVAGGSGSAVWALRTTTSYETAVRAAVDLGGDMDTVAAVTGGLAGAVYGVTAVPERWTGLLHVPLPGFADRVLRTADLADLTHLLTG